MEVILKEDVQNLGFKDDVVFVKNGYGRNFLIPTKKAVLATGSAKKILAENLRQRTYKEEKIVKEAKDVAQSIRELDIKIPSKVGKMSKLFGSVSNSDISLFLGKHNHKIDKKFINISGGTVKRLGKYNASIRLHRDVIIEVQFEIVAE